MTNLSITNLSVSTNGATLVRNASLTVAQGELVILLGPNGAGKTSLLKAALGLEKSSSGVANIDGQDCAKLSSSERARLVAYLPQKRPLAWPSIVRDVVSLGRYAYGAAPGRLSVADAMAVTDAIEKCDLTHLADRPTDTLSGGELARVHCARAFATQAPLIVADEPVAALDPRHQFRVMDIFKNCVADGGGVFAVLHDVSLAARYATRLVWMKDGKICADGKPEETLTDARLADIYGVKAHVEGRDIRFEGSL